MLFNNVTYEFILNYISEQIYKSAQNITIAKWNLIDSKFKYDWSESHEGESYFNNYKWEGDPDTYVSYYWYAWNRGWQYVYTTSRRVDKSGLKPGYTIKQTNNYYISQPSSDMTLAEIQENIKTQFRIFSNNSIIINSNINYSNQFLYLMQFIIVYIENTLILYTSMLSDNCYLTYHLISDLKYTNMAKIPNDEKINDDIIKILETIGDNPIDGILNSIWIYLNNRIGYRACEYEIDDTRRADKSYLVDVKSYVNNEENPDSAEIEGIGYYSKDTTANISLVESPGYSFKHYLLENGSKKTSKKYSFKVTKNTTISAILEEKNKFTVTYKNSTKQTGNSDTKKTNEAYKLKSLYQLRTVAGFKDHYDAKDNLLQWNTDSAHGVDGKRYANELSSFFNTDFTIYPLYSSQNPLSIIYINNETLSSATDYLLKDDSKNFAIRDMKWINEYATKPIFDPDVKILDYWICNLDSTEYNFQPGISSYAQLKAYIPSITSKNQITLYPKYI